MAVASTPSTISTKLQRIAKLARESPDMGFTTLAHSIDIEWLHEAYRRTRKSGAPGVDGQTAEAYAADLEGNLRSLLDRMKAGTYRAPPVRRVHIPKGDGKTTRPLGIPTFEDKVLQRAVAMVLEAVYEQDFLDCSYGFRPGRSVHQALEAVWNQAMEMHGGWILEVDIRKFFDTLEHARLREILEHRVRDKALLRLIGKWLNAGVQEDGSLTHPDAGTPQGGVISPLLANIYLHEVLDRWFEREVRPRLKGRAFLVRYADDFVIGFEREDDARRVYAVLPKRFEKYGLALHPEKTRLIPFHQPRPPSWRKRDDDDRPPPGNFDLLGFNLHWGQSRRGSWVVQHTTSKARFTRAITAVRRWCRFNRHRPIAEQHHALSEKMRGHYAFYGVTGNARALCRYALEVFRVWWKWLGRRSQKVNWDALGRAMDRWPLPAPVVVRSIYRKRAAKP